MRRLGTGLFALLAGAHAGCGGSAPACLPAPVQFSRASITVDPNKQMAALTTDERASVCAEFSRALTDSFGMTEIGCKFGSHAGNRQGMATCPAWYDECLQMAAPATIMYCTEKMSGMWSCPVTIGQYTECFNDLESALLTFVQIAAPCASPDLRCVPPSPPSCAVADCDYTWFD
jgi:hypothetical protein